jgi:hypothetical protein
MKQCIAWICPHTLVTYNADILLPFLFQITHASLPNSAITEMSTRNIKIKMFLGSKVWRVRKADNLTAIYEPIV